MLLSFAINYAYDKVDWSNYLQLEVHFTQADYYQHFSPHFANCDQSLNVELRRKILFEEDWH
jgi:hypothetical protein